MTIVSGLNVTPQVIDGWNEIVGFIPSVIEDGVLDILEYLKSKDYSMVSDNEVYQMASITSKKLSTSDSMLGKIFGFFFSE